MHPEFRRNDDARPGEDGGEVLLCPDLPQRRMGDAPEQVQVVLVSCRGIQRCLLRVAVVGVRDGLSARPLLKSAAAPPSPNQSVLLRG
eukprot:7464399-Pyramimonas_sp.AAC.1